MDGTTPLSAGPGAAPGRPREDAAWRTLQAATAGLHAQVESVPLMAALMSPAVDEGIVAEVLQALLRIHAGWEQANAARLQALDWPWRPRAEGLRYDLMALGVRPDTGQVPGPVAACEAEAWGMLYVVEGSALGGQLIARHLRAHLPGVGAAVRHFESAEGPGWPAFRAALEQALPDAGRRARAVAGAQAMFTHFHGQLFHGQLARNSVVHDDAGTVPA